MPAFPASDGFAVAAWDLGGDGEPVVMAHATGFHGLVWWPLANALPEFHCYSFDERGHGDSIRPPEHSYDWTGFADDALAVVDGFALDRPFGVGHSAGGAALLMAEAFRPGTFRGAVIDIIKSAALINLPLVSVGAGGLNYKGRKASCAGSY